MTVDRAFLHLTFDLLSASFEGDFYASTPTHPLELSPELPHVALDGRKYLSEAK